MQKSLHPIEGADPDVMNSNFNCVSSCLDSDEENLRNLPCFNENLD